MTESTIDLPVLGMTCAACVGRVERAVAGVSGVASADVNLVASRARIAWRDDAKPELAAVAAAIREAGYEVPADAIDATRTSGARVAAIAKAEQQEVAGLHRDAIVAIALTLPLVAVAMSQVLDALPSVIVQLVLGTIVLFGPGRRYLRGGWIAVRHRSPDMNTLIALGAGAAWLSSAVVTARWLSGPRTTAPEIYFEAGAAIVAFVMIGKLLESRARAQISDAVRGLLALAPPQAHRIVDGVERDIDVATLAAGDVVAVRPGERLAADGTVVEGSSALDESMLTGESLPVDKNEGSPVYAGTLNHHGALVVRVARAGADTALGRIARAVEDAQGNKAPIARLADRVSAWFVPAVLVVAAVTFTAWWISGAPPGLALERAIAVLVIACPCALGLATPAAVAVGTSRGAELGVLYAGGDALERASQIDVVCTDKTGTLTTGKPTLVGEIADELLGLVASAEQASEHPIARAIVTAARARGLSLRQPTQVVVEAGGGLSARVGDHAIRIGTREFAAAEEAAVRPNASASYVVIDGVSRGVIEVADVPAAGARDAVAKLRTLGVDVVMVTGDREGPANMIAKAVGITKVHFDVRPTAKAAIVDGERSNQHRVAMVGDGINDAVALAASDLGIAIGSGAELAAAAADITLLRDGITALPIALALARETLHTIRRNLVAAFAYNLVCIPIAAAGLLSPMLAAAAMSLSSVSVLVSSLRLKRWQMR